MLWLIAGLVVFLGIHSTRVFAPRLRENFIAARGAGAWKGLYTLLSIGGFVLLIYGYGQARFDNVFLYSSPKWTTHVQILLMIPAMILLVASQLPTGRIKKTVKNPQLIGVKIWAIGHLLVNGDLASWLLFGGFLAWAVILVINTNKRNQSFPDKTSAMGDILSIVIGLGVWALFMFWLHEWLIGVPVIA
jgi:uncharacterized membrane protein